MKTTKKILSILLALLMITSIIPVSSITASAATSGTCGENLTWTFDESTGTLTISGTGAMYNYDSNNRPWESYEDKIKTVVINNGVETISEYAFSNCVNITNVTIPESLVAIGDMAFSNCTSLVRIYIPKNVSDIGNCVFSRCNSLINISVDSENEYYSNDEYGVLFINGAFSDKKALFQYPIGNKRTSYTITSNVDVILESSFENCTSLENVTILSDLNAIEKCAFKNCSKLTKIVIPDSLTIIDEYAFSYCTSLIEINIPYNLKTIGNHAFYECDSIKKINIPENVTSIGNRAFGRNNSLTCITVDADNKYYSSDEYGTLFNKNKSTLIQYPIGNTRTTYKIPHGVTSLGVSLYFDGVFQDCVYLENIEIPNSVERFGNFAFSGCSKLVNLIIPNSVTTISNGVFSDCYNLTTISIPNNVKSIGHSVFSGCTNLINVTLGNGITSIHAWTFFDCTSLIYVKIPNSVTSIYEKSFYNCINLTDIYFSGNVDEWKKIKKSATYLDESNLTIHYNSTGPDDIGHTHNYSSVLALPTCTEQGCTTYTCSCGDSYMSDYVPATGHNFVNGVCTYCGSSNSDIPTEPEDKSGTLTITENPIILVSGDTLEHAITAVYNDDAGNPVLDADIQWTVSDNSIAEIVKTQTAHGSTLIFKAKKDGAVKFTAHYLDKTAVCYVFVGKMSPQLYINTSSVNQDAVGYMFDVTIGNFGCSAYTQQQIKEATAENVNVTIKLPDGFSFYEDDNANEMTTLLLDGYAVAPGKSEKLSYTIYKIGEPASNKMTIAAKGSNTSECKQTVKIFTDGRDLTEENRKEINESIKVSFEVLDDYRKIQQRGGKIEHGYRYANTILEGNEIPVKVTIYNSIPNKYNEYAKYIESNSEFDFVVNDISFTTGSGFKNVKLNSSFDKTTIKGGEYITVYGTAVIDDGYLPMQDNEKQKSLSATVDVSIKNKSDYRQYLNITVNNISYKGASANQSANPSTELKKIPNAECSLVGLMELGLSSKQCEYLSKLILTELSIYSIPTQSLEEYISEKILKKVFGYKKLLELGNGEFVITIPLEIDGEKIEIDLINTVFGASWNGTGIGNIDEISYEAYKIEKGFLGREKRAKTPYKTGVAGVATIANVKEFFEAVCDYTLDSVKSASKSVLGNVKEVERFLFGDCALNILNKAGYDSFFDYGWSIYVNECKEVAFECPVDIYVYNQNDELCGTIINNVPTSMDDEIELEVVNDTKIVRMYSSGYYIKTVSTCKGKLSVSVTERDYNNGARRIVTYDNLQLDIGTEYVQNYGDGFNVEASTYDIIFEDGSKKTPDNEILLLEDNFNVYDYTFSIQSPSRTEIRNKDGIILHAVVDGNAPDGSYVRWESSNGNFDEDANGYDLEIIAKNKGWTTFTAILCDADGNELARDSVEMYSKSGFFDKIGGFFRSLFGTTKIYEN